MRRLTFAFLLMFLMINSGTSRSIRENVVMISDGIYQKLTAPTVTCEPPYGFLPCTTQLWGLLFLIVVYQYLLSLGQKYVSAGSDLFFTAFGPGIFGASLFQFLGTIPQVALIVVSRLSGDPSSAQTQSGIGISSLAGSAVLNLTLVWGIAVALGSHDLSEEPISSQVEKQKKTGFGVKTDVDTSYTARIMIISIIPLLILQLTKIFSSSSGSRLVVLMSLIVTLLILFAYAVYQIFQPWIQNRRFEYLTLKFVEDKLLRLLSINGKPNVPLIREVFHEIDKSKDSHVSTAELRLLILGIQLEDDGFIRADYAEKVMEMFDISGDDNIDEEEFVKGISKWLVVAQKSASRRDHKTHNNDTEQGQSLFGRRKRT